MYMKWLVVGIQLAEDTTGLMVMVIEGEVINKLRVMIMCYVL